jgi:hypothetical protein
MGTEQTSPESSNLRPTDAKQSYAFGATANRSKSIVLTTVSELPANVAATGNGEPRAEGTDTEHDTPEHDPTLPTKHCHQCSKHT